MTEAPRQDVVRFGLVAACFVLSGFAALLYETVWLRAFAIVFGTSEQALAVVLSTYMGGLAIGSIIAARVADRIRRPLLTYGLLELGIAACALLVPLGLAGARWIQVALFGGNDEPPAAGNASQVAYFFVSAFVVTILPTAMMGATLPLLARHVVRSDEHLGRRVGALYAINVLGAVGGTLTAAFLALPALGLQKTTWIGAAINVLVFLIVWRLLSRGVTSDPVTNQVLTDHTSNDRELDTEPDAPVANKPSVTTGRRSKKRTRSRSATARGSVAADVAPSESSRSGLKVHPDASPLTFILPIIALSGAVSFAYEILFTRMLGHILGGSIFAFASMLASFLMGIALGAAVASRFATDRQRAASVFTLSQLAIAVLALASWHLIEMLAGSINELAATNEPFPVPRSLLSILILLPPATAIGMTFPLAIRIHARDQRDAASSSAKVYAWNTVGGVLGAFVTGTYLLPATNYGLTLVAAAVLNLILALLMMLNFGMRIPAAAAAIATTVALAIGFPALPEELLRTSLMPPAIRNGVLTFFESGRSSTVTVHYRNGMYTFATNGLPEAGTDPKGWLIEPTVPTIWLGGLPALIHPDAKSMCVIGFGTGKAAAHALSTIESIDVFELEQGVINGNLEVADQRARDPLSDPRIHIIMNDGRSGLAMTGKRYDAIVSQPSHPWTAGASHLYSREFARLVKSRLNPDGVFIQWMDSSFIDIEVLRSLGASLFDVFPHVQLYQTDRTTLFFVARNDTPANELPRVDPSRYEDQDNLAALGIDSPVALRPVLSLDSDSFRRMCEGATPTTDDNNRMALKAQAFDVDLARYTPIDKTIEAFDPLCDPDRAVDIAWDEGGPDLRGYVARRRSLLNRVENAKAVVAAGNDETLPLMMEGLLKMYQGQLSEAAEPFAQTLKINPDDESAACLLRLIEIETGRPLNGDQKRLIESVALPSRYVQLLEMAERIQTRQLGDMSELDDAMRDISPLDPLYPKALKLRIDWRLADRSPTDRRERGETILNLFARLAAYREHTTLLPSRIAGSLLANRPLAALASVQMLIEGLGKDKTDTPPTAAEIDAKLGYLKTCQEAMDAIERDRRIEEHRKYEVLGMLRQATAALNAAAEGQQ